MPRRELDDIDREAERQGAAISRHRHLKPRNTNDGGTKSQADQPQEGMTLSGWFGGEKKPQ